MRASIIAIVVVGILMVPAFGAIAESSLIDQSGTVLETRRYDLGRSTNVGAEFMLGSQYWAGVSAGFHFETGVALPIDVIVARPATISRNADIPVQVDVQGTDAGRFWMGFFGWASVYVLGYNLSLAKFEIPLKDYAEFSVPVGSEKAQTFSTSDIQIASYSVDLLVADITATLYFSVQVEFITDSYVTGSIQMVGRCLESQPSKECTWSGTMPASISGRLASTAFPGESFEVRTSNLQYHLTKLQMKLKSFTVGVGFSGSVLGIDYNEPNALEATVPLGDISPELTLYNGQSPRGRATSSSGLIMDANFVEPLDAISMLVTIPASADTIFMNPFIVGIIVVVVVAGAYSGVRRRHKKAIVTGTDYYACPDCGEAVWYQPQFHGWYCNRCMKTATWGPIKKGVVSYYGCPDCAKPVAWVADVHKWSCGHCNTNPSSGPIVDVKE